jgi:hypothetical protein
MPLTGRILPLALRRDFRQLPIAIGMRSTTDVPTSSAERIWIRVLSEPQPTFNASPFGPTLRAFNRR